MGLVDVPTVCKVERSGFLFAMRIRFHPQARELSHLRWCGFALLLALGLGRADSPPVTVTITQRSPLEIFAPDGTMSGVKAATIGTHFALVSCDGRLVTLQDAQGTHYRIALASTDYVPPIASPSSPAPVATTASMPASTNAPVVTAPPSPPNITSPSSSVPAAATDTMVSDDVVAKINAGFGKPLFTTQSFWKESALLIANRLGLKLEDKTKWETAYRRYFYDERSYYAPAPIVGGKAYCVALYADANDTPTSLLIAFTNDGDYQSVARLTTDLFRLKHPTGPSPADADQQLAALQTKVDALQQSFEPDRKAEQDTLAKNLTTLFGDGKPTTFGSSTATREDALRWDWNGVSFLLTGQANKYNLLRVIPTELADNHGRTERIPHDEMVAKLTESVEHRPNGDVVITQLPMADQGLKGYCVPATWERVLRYTGVPGDMYTLSRIGNSGFGGGTWGGTVAAQLDDTLHDYGRRAEFIDVTKIDTFSLHRYIDKGIPIFWDVNPAGYAASEQRYGLCDREREWDTWKKLLDQARAPSVAKPAPLENDGGHQVLITGYNPETKEIAWSDPWGRDTRERWMTQEEAQLCSLGEFYIITW